MDSSLCCRCGFWVSTAKECTSQRFMQRYPTRDRMRIFKIIIVHCYKSLFRVHTNSANTWKMRTLSVWSKRRNSCSDMNHNSVKICALHQNVARRLIKEFWEKIFLKSFQISLTYEVLWASTQTCLFWFRCFLTSNSRFSFGTNMDAPWKNDSWRMNKKR